MIDQVLFLEMGLPKPSLLYEAWVSAGSAEGVRSSRLSSMEDLAEVTIVDKTAFVLNWSESASPEYVVETILQNPLYCRAPLVVVCSKVSTEELDFLKEYSIPYVVRLQTTVADATMAILRNLTRDVQGGPRELRSFYADLHGRELTSAARRLAALAPNMVVAERLFLQGQLLKAAKRFDDAKKMLGQGLITTQKDRVLEPRFLHLLGNVAFKCLDFAQAKAFLEAAQKVTSTNLRRQFILGQLYFELGEPTLALKRYQTIFARMPKYAGIHGRLAELTYGQAQSPDALARLPEILREIPEQKLVGLYKKLTANSHGPTRRAYVAQLTAELLHHAEVAVERDDFYSALSLFQKAEKLGQPLADAVALELKLRRIDVLLLAQDLAGAETCLAELKGEVHGGPRLAKLLDRLERAKARIDKTA